MSPIRSILALADFSPKSDNAVARAALLARAHGAALHLLHVLAPRRFAAASMWTPDRDDLDVRLERARQALAALAARTSSAHGVEAVCIVRAGDTLDVIVEESRDADLVVVAAKRSNPLRDFVLRAPTERLLRILQKPMLVVKRAALSDYAEMLVPASGSWQGGVLAAPALHRRSGPGDDLVVVPKNGKASMGNFLLGRLAQRFVAQAHCDVLVFPNTAGMAEKRQTAVAERGAAARRVESARRGEATQPA